MNKLFRTLVLQNPDAIVPEGIWKAFIGMVEIRGNPPVAVFDRALATEILKGSGWTDQEADIAVTRMEITDEGNEANAPIFVTFTAKGEPLPSEDIQKITGFYVPTEERSPLLQWITEEMRNGRFQHSIEEFAEQQSEKCDARTVMADRADPDVIYGRFPVMMIDHESKSPFRVDVAFRLDPVTLAIFRLD